MLVYSRHSSTLETSAHCKWSRNLGVNGSINSRAMMNQSQLLREAASLKQAKMGPCSCSKHEMWWLVGERQEGGMWICEIHTELLGWKRSSRSLSPTQVWIKSNSIQPDPAQSLKCFPCSRRWVGQLSRTSSCGISSLLALPPLRSIGSFRTRGFLH